MKTLKYSRQRESIKTCLMGRKDHPTADALYTSIREQSRYRVPESEPSGGFRRDT